MEEGADRKSTESSVLPEPPRTSPPAAVREAIKARVLESSLQRRDTVRPLDGRYRLVREIGRGGAGTVWEAELLPLGRRVAVKLLRARNDQEEAGSRLLREALTVSRIGHEHIVRVDDVGTDEHGATYVVMELLAGQSLAEAVVAGGKLPLADVRVVTAQICDALRAAHDLGVVHRDLKPANVFAVRRPGTRWHIKLLDFGLCKTPLSGRQGLTEVGAFLGTPGYLAPEQIRGQYVDARADQYALGCVVVELLTGRPAFEATTRDDVLRDQLAGARARHLEAQGASAELIAVLDQAMAVAPQDRFVDVPAFTRALAATDGPRAASASAPRTGSRTAPRRSALGRGYLLGVVTTLACATGIVIAVRGSSERRDDVPHHERTRPTVMEPHGESEPTGPSVSQARSPTSVDASMVARSPEPTGAPVQAAPMLDPGPESESPPPRKARRRRSAAPQHQDDEVAASPPSDRPARRRAYAAGIRDPFANL